jgi:hypothetical protein
MWRPETSLPTRSALTLIVHPSPLTFELVDKWPVLGNPHDVPEILHVRNSPGETEVSFSCYHRHQYSVDCQRVFHIEAWISTEFSDLINFFLSGTEKSVKDDTGTKNCPRKDPVASTTLVTPQAQNKLGERVPGTRSIMAGGDPPHRTNQAGASPLPVPLVLPG